MRNAEYPKVPRPFRPLASSLVRRVVAVAILCSIVVAGVQAIIAVGEERHAFEREIQAIAATNVPLFSVALWDIEPEAIRRQMAEMARRPEIAYVRLEERSGHVFEAGAASLRDPAALRLHSIPYPQARNGTLGSLEITPNAVTLQRRIVERIFVILAGYAVLATVICVLVYVVLRAELERPMRILAKFTGELTPQTLTAPLEPLHKPRAYHDEIDLVADAFRTLQDGIHSHVANLDATVAIRTAQLEAALEENRALTITDPLTGCYNRRYLDTRLAEEVLRSRRSGHALSIIVADIDYFKKVNDTRGHAAGDNVLRVLAGVFRGAMRERMDFVARFGGEEFVAVLPDAKASDATAIAERLRGQVADTVTLHEGEIVRVTASFGVAQFEPEDTPAKLLARADAMLYAAKGAGRNRVMTASEATQ